MRSLKVFLLALLLGIVAFHFFLVGIYCAGLPDNSRLGHYAQYYVYPYFHQNWNLFVPPPSTNYMLIAEYKKADKTERIDLFNEVIEKHQANRLAGLEPLVIAMVNSIFYYEKNAPLQEALNPIVKNGDTNFKILEKVAKGYYTYTRGDAPADLRLTLVVDDLKPGRRRIYYQGAP